MRVAIVCGGAEPGRDGVGDHSRRLAQVLRESGHDACVVALRDPEVESSLPRREFAAGGEVLRFPASAHETARGRWLADQLAAFAPDRVLLQFVCWGHADRGIVEPLPQTVVAALSRHHVALYVHELWLGLQRGASLRHRWWGRRQRESMRRFFQAIRPACTVTSNEVHVAILRQIGFEARIVPLLSNLPPYVGARDAACALVEQTIDTELVRDPLFVAVFGTVFPGWHPDAALAWLQREADARGRDVALVAFGRPSPLGARALDSLSRRLPAGMPLARLGEVSPEIASGLMQLAHVGMPTTGWQLLGKSGVAAAMRVHGLPLVVVRDEAPFRGLPGLRVTHPMQVLKFDPARPPDFDALLAMRTAPRDTAPEVAAALLAALDPVGSAPDRVSA